MITLDITTNNTIYNPLSGQGSWIQHRFGRRNYPCISLDVETITDIFKEHKQVFLRSVYGDPLCHPEIESIIDLATINSVNLVIFSYLNIDATSLLEKIKDANISVFVTIDGIDSYGTTILNSNADVVFNNISKLGSLATVEYLLYTYNIDEVSDLSELSNRSGCRSYLQPGKNVGLPVTSIIDSSGTWLYDVVPLESINSTPTVDIKIDQTVVGYRSLLTYTKPVSGNSILNKPAISKKYQTDVRFPNDMPSISVTGHVFNSTEEMYAFSNALCPDWNIRAEFLLLPDGVNKLDEYSVLIGCTLNDILDRGLKRFGDSNI